MVMKLVAGQTFGRRPNWQNIPIGAAAYSTCGVQTNATTGSVYYTSLYIDHDLTLSTVVFMNGGTTFGNVQCGVWDQNGKLLTRSASSGAQVGPFTFQACNLTTAAFLPGPALVHVGIQFNNTTSTFMAVSSNSWVNYHASTVATTYANPTLSLTPANNFLTQYQPIVLLK